MAKRPTNNKLMNLAVEVMRKSIAEPRDDGKISPKVGAVLLKPDGSVETAARGELRYGDHAEYTLLERKNSDTALDGSMLFTTLEPCAPGSRRHPKVDCAERIVLARISEVWVGVVDPDPTVARKGIKHLEDHGITVHMFDRDLQDLINQENSEYFTQALERAAEAEVVEEVVLSSLETTQSGSNLDQFSDEALSRFRDRSQISDPIDSAAFTNRLVSMGACKAEEGMVVPTRNGIILFGREPRMAIPSAGLLCLVKYADGKQERKEFDQPAVLIPGLVEDWLNTRLPSIQLRETMERKTVPALPFVMLREAIVNALIHRDYDIEGAKCQLVVEEGAIIVKSPGAPIPPITLEQIKSFAAPMLSRNPILHYVFSRMGLAEEQGLGLSSLRDEARRSQLPQPKYTWEDPYLVLTLYRSTDAAVGALDPEVLASLSTAEQEGWHWIVTQASPFSKGTYAKEFKLPDRTALNHLTRFIELGLLKKSGSGPATRYSINS